MGPTIPLGRHPRLGLPKGRRSQRPMPPKPFDLTSRHALVTGCGSEHGIGFASARMLARLGARISITSTTERIHERESELGDETSSLSDRRFGSCRRSLWLPKSLLIGGFCQSAVLAIPVCPAMFVTIRAHFWNAGGIRSATSTWAGCYDHLPTMTSWQRTRRGALETLRRGGAPRPLFTHAAGGSSWRTAALGASGRAHFTQRQVSSSSKAASGHSHRHRGGIGLKTCQPRCKTASA
jgi:NAD(P)-dependent dehydrogenase (short-subunit alcohol dehydrogenase family)